MCMMSDAHDGIVSFIPLADNLKHLDLGYIMFVSDKTLEAIGSSSCPITVLNLESCHITDCGLRFLTNGSCSKTIKELVLKGCHRITDSGVSLLQKMCALEELNLADCREVTDVGGVAISAIRTLKKLDFARGPKVTAWGPAWGPRVTDRTILALAENCLNLEILDLSGNKFVTGVGIRAFLGHKCLQSLDLRYIRVYVSGSDLEDLALACPSLKSILVEGGWRKRLLGEMQESAVSRFVRFN
ncbi:putative leucine-rich repeat domain, L domain-containing protein [Rosa chinensis]|uniref:Putative leucine-rich repeat domain, L domain-containing protein n=1 Tax=Rosa chinensis TaxID=74649 RepID=A0A2P6RAK7_ROSCH|nr:F-box/LRR-repeat protein 2 [Rosa chinensis]PRQ43465.1 putative leucine-rich repeat domain, L domain-containing protein [Rosa chinensis]